MRLLVLEGPRTELTVRWAPDPSLHYRDPAHDVETADVRQTENELGTTLAAAIEQADAHRLTLTLVVPPFRFPPGRDVLPVTTFAVLTLRREDGDGALARYQVIHLHGSAHTA